MTIVIVDDDTGIREMLGLFLAHKGYTAARVSNGSEALTYLQHHQPLPELILLDLMMPIMDGMEFRRVQQHDAQLAAIPVVVMSAAENILAQAPTLTADAYLSKPIDFDALLKLVERYCTRSRQQGG